jgi:hypothetical protein
MGYDGLPFCSTGPKAFIHTNRQTVIIVSPPFTPTAASASSTIRRAAASATINGLGTPLNESAKLTIFDLENKFVAYSGVFKDGIRETFSSSDQVFVVGGDGKVSRALQWQNRRIIAPSNAATTAADSCPDYRNNPHLSN